jgi:hypothetical protein
MASAGVLFAIDVDVRLPRRTSGLQAALPAAAGQSQYATIGKKWEIWPRLSVMSVKRSHARGGRQKMTRKTGCQHPQGHDQKTRFAR